MWAGRDRKKKGPLEKNRHLIYWKCTGNFEYLKFRKKKTFGQEKKFWNGGGIQLNWERNKIVMVGYGMRGRGRGDPNVVSK